MFKKVVVVAVLTPWFVQQNKCQTTTFLFFGPAEMQTERTGGALLLSAVAVAGKAIDSTQLTTHKCQKTTFLPTGRNADRKDRWWVTIIRSSRESGRQHAAYHQHWHPISEGIQSAKWGGVVERLIGREVRGVNNASSRRTRQVSNSNWVYWYSA